MSTVASVLQIFGCVEGPRPPSSISPPGGGTLLGELWNAGIVALPSRPKLRRGFDFGLHSCLPAGISRCRPVSIQGIIAFFPPFHAFRVGVLSVHVGALVRVWMFLFPPPPFRSPCPCRFEFSPLDTCACTLRLALPTSRGVPCSKCFLCSRRLGAWNFVLRQLKKECPRARVSCIALFSQRAPRPPSSILHTLAGAVLGELCLAGVVKFRGACCPRLAPQVAARVRLWPALVPTCRHYRWSPRSHRTRYRLFSALACFSGSCAGCVLQH